MLSREEFLSILRSERVLVLDGGLATELEAHGHDLTHPLWSGKILLEQPGAIKQVHHDYFLAGANVAITSSYQVSERGLMEQLGVDAIRARDLVTQSVVVADAARKAAYEQGVPADRILLVAGSVGPYGAYLADGSEYRGDYDVSIESMMGFHRARISALIAGGADLLAIETIPSYQEVIALLRLLDTEFPDVIAFLSCTMRDAEHICDGTAIPTVIDAVNASKQVIAFGINCVPPSIVTEFLQTAKPLTELPLLCYPNSGEVYDGQSKIWSAGKGGSELAWKEWIDSGAHLIGGCCRTSPKHIKALRSQMRDLAS